MSKQRAAILGGRAVRTEPFPSRKCMGTEEKNNVLEVMDSDHLSTFLGGPGAYFKGGEKVKEFENKWKTKFGFKHAVSVNSWTTGLMCCMGAIGIEPGDEVICPPYTMTASVTAAMFYGGIPVFADIDPDTFCIDPASIRKVITDRTKAIVVVHLFGHPADMDEIMAIADEYNLRVVEDAAQAPGVKYKGRQVGAIGDIGGFSFNYHKHIHTGEGGMIVTNNDDLAFGSQLIRNHGENSIEYYEIKELSNVIGANYRLTELQAAIGMAQIDKLDNILETRRELAEQLNKRLDPIDGLTVQKMSNGSDHAYYIYPIRYDADKVGLSRNLFLRSVLAELPEGAIFENIPMTEGYVKPIYLNPLFQNKIAIGRNGFPFSVNSEIDYQYPKGLCPVTERMYEKELLLCPLVREPLTVDDINDIADAIEKVVENAPVIRDEIESVV